VKRLKYFTASSSSSSPVNAHRALTARSSPNEAPLMAAIFVTQLASQSNCASTE